MNRVTFVRSTFFTNLFKNCNLKDKTQYFNSNKLSNFAIKNNSLKNVPINPFVSQLKNNLIYKPPFNSKSCNLYLFRFNSTDSSNTVIKQTGSISIFKRFKEAYKQHGKILLWCHFISCWGWVIGFFFLARAGFDITSLFSVLEKLKIMTRETSDSLNNKINTFNLEKFLKDSFFHHILSDSIIKTLGQSITGQSLKYLITAIILYKIITPLRYVFTLAVTNLIIKLFKRQGKIPMQPPPGSSITELYKEQKQVIRRSLKKQREKYYKRNLFRAKYLNDSGKNKQL